LRGIVVVVYQGGITRPAGKRSYFDFVEVTQGLGALEYTPRAFTYSTGWAFVGRSAACAPAAEIPAADPKRIRFTGLIVPLPVTKVIW
jgi:hypothetical protein